ncbi:MAG: hypothetical protein ACJLS2_12740 [Microcella pacifica]|uniref:Glycerophosphoryl diester phosphodiesterase membrane domain-containing protein n=1 Tax=Microcella pacifica TaxID=2591847 RepID=A0A9E5MK95_9MICO|nr:hypothetical protein [Microcella pacifica]NHF62854.1 hypothetical protein [Microcella pacifica]
MTNDSPWQSPGWQPSGNGDSSDPGGAPGASPGGYAPAPGQPAAGWTPPPKPGLIPLRPLDFGTILGGTFQVLRRNPRPTFGAALLINALVVIVTFGLTFGVSFWAVDRELRASADDLDAVSAGTVGLIILSGIIAVAVSLVAQAVLQGVIVLEVSRATLGEKLTLRALLARGRGRWWALIGWTALLSLVLIVALTVLVLLIAGMAVAAGPAGPFLAVGLGILGGLGFAVLAAWLWIKFALVPTAIMLERLPLGAAIRRGWTLVIGHFWRTFGILLLVTVMVQIASGVVSFPFQLAAGFGGALVNPAGDPTGSIALIIGSNVLLIAITVVIGAIGSVLLSSATALLYIDIRMRKEGLDLDLQRVVEERAAGLDPHDPYEAAARPDAPYGTPGGA